MKEEYNLESLASQNDSTNDHNVFSLSDNSFELPLRISSFLSEKEFDNFIKCVEKLVRYSHEYRLWVRYVTEHLGYSQCALTKESINECPLEIHHHPINLYTIVRTLTNDLMVKKQEFSTFDVALKVIEHHFQNKIGYVVLLSDLHKKYHCGFLDIPIELVHGNYKYVMQHYTIEENEFDKICRLCNVHIADVKKIWSKDNYPGITEYKSENQIDTPAPTYEIQDKEQVKELVS
jgi:hypothetical protein